MHFWLQNAPWAPRASLVTRQTRSKLKNRKVHFLRFLCWNPSLMENWFSIISIFENEFCNSFFVQKSIIPPLRTKRYYSKPKWRSRRHKSLKMRKTQLSIFLPQSHILLQKCILGSFLAVWAIFTLLAPNGPKKHQETITPTSFWATGPKKRILSSKMRKMLKMHPNAPF